MGPLFDAVIKNINPPVIPSSEPKDLQCLVANIDYDSFKGKLGVARVTSGSVKAGQPVALVQPGQEPKTGRVGEVRSKRAKRVANGLVVSIALEVVVVVVERQQPRCAPRVFSAGRRSSLNEGLGLPLCSSPFLTSASKLRRRITHLLTATHAHFLALHLRQLGQEAGRRGQGRRGHHV